MTKLKYNKRFLVILGILFLFLFRKAAFIFLLLISPLAFIGGIICLIIGLIKPSLFSHLFKKRLSKNKILLVLLTIITASTILMNKTANYGKNNTTNNAKNVKTEKIDEKQQQKEHFLKIYDDVLKTVKISNTMFYTSHNLLTKTPRATMYESLKEHEKMQGELSILFIEIGSKIPPSLDKYKDDINQSLHELATVCAHRQLESKHLANYINTGDLESYRKAKNEMEGTGEILSNAVSRLILGVGKKLDMNTQELEEKYEKINIEVKQEFKDRFEKQLK